jgi:HK97 family phage prohead protease
VYNHLAAHLKDAGKDVPELKTLTLALSLEGRGEDDVERRSFEVELRVVGEPAEEPVIEGMAAVYGKKSEVIFGFREIIEQGFFDVVLNQDVRALWNHNADLVLGRTKNHSLALEDNERGLGVRIRPPDTQAGKDALTLIKRGDVNQMSFGFQVKAEGGSEWKKESDGSLTRILKRGGCSRLYDVSPVTFPAYPQTSAHVRSMVEQLTAEGQEPEAEPDETNSVQVHLIARRHEMRKTDINFHSSKGDQGNERS